MKHGMITDWKYTYKFHTLIMHWKSDTSAHNICK